MKTKHKKINLVNLTLILFIGFNAQGASTQSIVQNETVEEQIANCRQHYVNRGMAARPVAATGYKSDSVVDQCESTRKVKDVWVGISKNGQVEGWSPNSAQVQMGQAFITFDDGAVEVLEFPVSTGTLDGKGTPETVATSATLHQNHCTREVQNRPMPYAIMYDGKRGIALHEGVVNGRPSSKGCVRIPREHIRKIFCAVKSAKENNGKFKIVVKNEFAHPPKKLEELAQRQVFEKFPDRMGFDRSETRTAREEEKDEWKKRAFAGLQ